MDVSILGSSIQIHRTKATLGLTLSKIQQKYFDTETDQIEIYFVFSKTFALRSYTVGTLNPDFD